MSCPHGVDTYIQRCGACDTVQAIGNSGPSMTQRIYERAVAQHMTARSLTPADCRAYLANAKLACQIWDEPVREGLR